MWLSWPIGSLLGFFATAPDVGNVSFCPLRPVTVLKVCSIKARLASDFSSSTQRRVRLPHNHCAQASQRWMSPVAERELLEYNRRVLIINQQLGRRENSELWPKDNHKPPHNCPSWMDGELPFPADAHLCALLVHLFRPLSPVMTARRVSAADARAARRPHHPPPPPRDSRLWRARPVLPATSE